MTRRWRRSPEIARDVLSPAVRLYLAGQGYARQTTRTGFEPAGEWFSLACPGGELRFYPGPSLLVPVSSGRLYAYDGPAEIWHADLVSMPDSVLIIWLATARASLHPGWLPAAQQEGEPA